MKLLSVPYTGTLPVLNSRDGNIRTPARSMHNPSNDEIFLKPIAVIRNSIINGTIGNDIREKGSVVDIYA